MMKTYPLAAVLCLTTLSAVSAEGEQIKKAAVGVDGGAEVKDKDDWTGDQVQIQANLGNLKLYKDSKAPAAGAADKKTYIAPAYARFDVSSDKDGELIITPRENFKIDNGKVFVTPSETHRIYNTLNFTQPMGATVMAASDSLVSPYVAYRVKKSEVEAVPYIKYGWSFGALLVPFKYHYGEKELTNSTSYQAYVEYKRQSNGLSDGPFIAGGFATAGVTNSDGSTSSKIGFSGSVGWIFEVRKGSGFQLALMAGKDRFGSNAGYGLDGKNWVAFSIGYQPQD